LPKYLVPDCTVRAPGVGPEIELGASAGKLLVLTLGIDRSIQQQGLTLQVWGSPDQVNWGTKPLLAFPQKYYCGMYSLLLNLAKTPNVRYLRAAWKVNRWGKDDSAPTFVFFVYVEESGARVRTAVA